jgi:hypothetical protein
MLVGRTKVDNHRMLSVGLSLISSNTQGIGVIFNSREGFVNAYKRYDKRKDVIEYETIG